jgi:thioredoxin 1
VAGNITELTEQTFEEEVLNAELPVLVDFWAEWCAPCKMLAPVLEDLSDELEGQVKFTKLDVDEHSELAQQFGIMSIPTMGIFKEGDIVDRLVGFRPKDALKKDLEEVVG